MGELQPSISIWEAGLGCKQYHEAHRLQAKALGEFIYRKVTATRAHTGSHQKTPDLPTDRSQRPEPLPVGSLPEGPRLRVGWEGRKGTGQVPEGTSQSEKWPSSLNCGLGEAGGEGDSSEAPLPAIQPAPLKPGMRTEAPAAAGGFMGTPQAPCRPVQAPAWGCCPGPQSPSHRGAPSLLVALVTRLFSRRFLEAGTEAAGSLHAGLGNPALRHLPGAPPASLRAHGPGAASVTFKEHLGPNVSPVRVLGLERTLSQHLLGAERGTPLQTGRADFVICCS